MATQFIRSAVVEEVVNRCVSSLSNYFHKLIGKTDPSRIERLEWKLLKIRSAIDESMKYDIKNEALFEMLQKFRDVAEEAKKVLHEYKRQAYAPLLNSTAVANTGDVRQITISISRWLSNIELIDIPLISEKMNIVLINMREREKINQILARMDLMSEDIGDYLRMLRNQRMKKNKRLRSAVVEEVVSRCVSSLSNYFHKLFGNTVPSNIEQLACTKIRSVLDERMKYDLKNEALLEILQKISNAVEEAEKTLQESKGRSVLHYCQQPEVR